MAYASTLQEPDAPWLHTVMNIDQSDFLKSPDYCATDPRPYLQLQGRILRSVRDFLAQHDTPFRCVWTRECGPRYSRNHTHALVFASPALAPELADLIRRIGGLHGRDVFISSNGSRGITTRAARAGVLRDLFECVSPKATHQGVSVWQTLGIEARRGKGCTILGKRSGTSESIGPTARATAGWKALHGLPELRTVMPTSGEARQERNRAYKRRKRAGGGSRPPRLPQHPSTTPSASHDDLGGLEDLLADFRD
jgi:hypothetical protein